MAGKGSRSVTYAVQEEPAFIKRFKEKIGYREDPGIDEKVLDQLGLYPGYFLIFTDFK